MISDRTKRALLQDVLGDDDQLVDQVLQRVAIANNLPVQDMSLEEENKEFSTTSKQIFSVSFKTFSCCKLGACRIHNVGHFNGASFLQNLCWSNLKHPTDSKISIE